MFALWCKYGVNRLPICLCFCFCLFLSFISPPLLSPPPTSPPLLPQGTHKDNNLNLLAFSIDANVYDRLGLVLLFSVYTFVVAFTYVHEHM